MRSNYDKFTILLLNLFLPLIVDKNIKIIFLIFSISYQNFNLSWIWIYYNCFVLYKSF